MIVQWRHFQEASAYQRFRQYVNPWAMPDIQFSFVEGDTEILPGILAIETSGHAPGHQSLLVRLPETGAVLLAIDAAISSADMAPEAPEMLQDMDHAEARASRAKLKALAEEEGVCLLVYGHDAAQWSTLKRSPDYYT